MGVFTLSCLLPCILGQQPGPQCSQDLPTSGGALGVFQVSFEIAVLWLAAVFKNSSRSFQPARTEGVSETLESVCNFM